jgi:hypothetical protein
MVGRLDLAAPIGERIAGSFTQLLEGLAAAAGAVLIGIR